MRLPYFPALAAVAVLAVLLFPDPDPGQPGPPGGPPNKPPPDEFRALIKEVEEAYKAPYEVDKDVLKELRKQYENPTPQREDKIFREIRRLYDVTPDQERAILRELRRAYDRPSADQEERLFREIRRNGQLPVGAVHPDAQVDQARKLFRKFDLDGDGVLSRDEMPDNLLAQRRRWDRNRDGVIDFGEYLPYYQAGLDWVSEKVAAGEIAIKLPKAAFAPPPEPPKPAEPEFFAVRYGKLPNGLPVWFELLDTDRDGQVGLYEWRTAGLPTAEFYVMDLDGDGLLTPDEYLRYVRLYHPEQAPPTSEARQNEPTAAKTKFDKPGKPDKPANSTKPDKPDKPNKPGKPAKSK